jgi:Helix-turn-helix
MVSQTTTGPLHRSPANSFIARLGEASAKFRSRAALAKAANIAPSSLQAYFEGTEPTRPALVALARAADVSIEWLADGRGYRDPHPPVPDGYAALPFYDISKSKGYIYPLVSEDIAQFVYVNLDWFRYSGMNPSKLFLIEATGSQVAEISDRELLVVDSFWRTKFADPIPKIAPGIYLVSQLAKLSIREVLGVAGDAVELVHGVKGKIRLHVGDKGFTIHGRIIWHSSALPTPALRTT